MLNTFKGHKLLAATALALAFSVTSCGIIPSQVDSAITAINVDESRLAIKGYDPVAYFTQSAAVQGSSTFTANHNGATYWFASKDNQQLFSANPSAYAPQYGGYCAFGVSKEKKFDIDPQAWSIVDNKLYLNLNNIVKSRWVLNTSELIDDADSIWQTIALQPADSL